MSNTLGGTPHNKMTNKTIKISTIGLDERWLNTLVFFFKKYCADRCKMVLEKEADVFIINMDHHKADADYERLEKEHSDSPFILMALNSVEQNKHYFLRKPMVASALMNIIDDIEKKSAIQQPISTQVLKAGVVVEAELNVEPDLPLPDKTFSGYAAELLREKDKVDFSNSAAKINFPERRDINNAKFNLDDYFLGAIFEAYKLAKESQSVVKLSGLWRPICFFPETGEVYIDLSDSQLRSVCVTSIQSQSNSVAPREIKIEKTRREWELSSCHKVTRFRSSENFIWKVALYTSRGRLPDFVDIKQVVSFCSWPNLTRLALSPDSLKLIAYWAALPRSIQDAVDSLGVDSRHVYSLYTALYVLGHIVVDNTTTEKLYVKKEQKLSSKTKEILAKMVARLRLA